MFGNDWNGDGKYDWQDSYIDYNVYKQCTKDEESGGNGGGNNNGGCSGNALLLGLVVIILAALLAQCGG